MGNSCCKLDIEDNEDVKQLKRPTWKSDKPLTEADVLRMREEFWDTEPHYGGDRGTLFYGVASIFRIYT